MSTAPGDVEITHGGHSCWLLPERALYWPSKGWLLVADTHWGKCQTLRDAGAPVPMGPLHSDLQRLRDVVGRVGARRVVVLGDLVHGPSAFAPGMDECISKWRPSLPCELALLPGNHDRVLMGARAVGLLERWGVELLPARLCADGLWLTHEPPNIANGAAVCGHVHPVVRLRGRGDSMRLPCYWLEGAFEALVLPAFSSLVDGATVRACPGDRMWAATGTGVFECG